MIDLPPNALWILLLAALGWAIPHFLKVSREKHSERTTEKTGMRFSDAEREILHHCGNADGWEKGHLWIIEADAFGRFVRAGKRDFFDRADPAVQARYLDAFESLLGRGYFRHDGGMLYRLTGAGYENAKQNP